MINLYTTLTLGERIDISLDGTSYRSVVQDVESKAEFLISQVTVGTLPLFIPRGMQVQMVFFRNNGMHYFPAEMVGVEIDGPLKMLRFTALEEPTRWQRRANFRMRMILPVRVWCEREDDGIIYRQENLCHTYDLSSTGTMIVCGTPYGIGSTVHIDLALDEQTSVAIQCEVRRVEQPENSGGMYRVALMFLNLSQRLLRYLSRFLMDEQIKLNRKI